MRSIEVLLGELIQAQRNMMYYEEHGPSRALKATLAERDTIRAEIVADFERAGRHLNQTRATNVELGKMVDAAVEVARIFNRDLGQRGNEVAKWKAWATYWQHRYKDFLESLFGAGYEQLDSFDPLWGETAND